jgi:hypothetical protein
MTGTIKYLLHAKEFYSRGERDSVVQPTNMAAFI